MPHAKRSAREETDQRPIAGEPILPIQRPGLYQSPALADYHGAAVVATGEYAVSSSSDLRTDWALLLSHLHEQWVHNPQAAPREETRPMLLGRAAHHLLLGEQNFAGHFATQPLVSRCQAINRIPEFLCGNTKEGVK